VLSDLFINTLLLISFTFVGGHVLREIPDNLKRRLSGKIMIGFGGGLLGILTMIYTIQVVGTNTLLDLRSVSMMMISHIGGLIPTIIAGFIMATYRVWYFGINQASIFAVIHICLYIALFHIINKTIEDALKNWFAKLFTVVVILSSTILYLLRYVENSYAIVLIYIVVVICSATLEYFLLKYAERSNELYRLYKKDSTKDFLTGLNNTRQFDRLLNMSFERAKENNEKLSCLMIDIDHFKKVNDTYGHIIGDKVLKEMAYILKKICRNFDIIGRIGGEEFCVLLLDCPLKHSFEVGTRIRDAVREHRFFIEDSKFINITVSIGVATFPDTVPIVDDIIGNADIALYKAKKEGRDRVCDNNNCILD
jgi:diguanylate cyclase